MTFVIDGFTLNVQKSIIKNMKKLKKDTLAWYSADQTTESPFSTLSNKNFKDFLYSTTFPQHLQILQKLTKEI